MRRRGNGAGTGEEAEMNYTYLLRCKDGSFYAGWTNDIEKRIKAHNGGLGARYTKTRRPVKLAYMECHETKSAAMKREAALKKLSHRQKEELAASVDLPALLASLDVSVSVPLFSPGSEEPGPSRSPCSI